MFLLPRKQEQQLLIVALVIVRGAVPDRVQEVERHARGHDLPRVMHLVPVQNLKRHSPTTLPSESKH